MLGLKSVTRIYLGHARCGPTTPVHSAGWRPLPCPPIRAPPQGGLLVCECRTVHLLAIAYALPASA